MIDGKDERLEQAYELISNEQLVEAQGVLQDILDQNPDNVDAWWLMANAVTEPAEAKEALQKVIELEPEHVQAQGLLNELDKLLLPEALDTPDEIVSPDFEAAIRDTLTTESLGDAAYMEQPDFPVDLPEIEADIDEDVALKQLEADDEGATPALDFGTLFDDESAAFGDEDLPPFDDDISAGELEEAAAQESAKPSRSRSLLRMILFLLLIAVIIVGGILILNRQQPATVDTPMPTTPPVAEALEPSDAVQTVLDAAANAANAQSDLLGGETTVHYESRDSEATLVLKVCRTAGPDLSEAMDIAMDLAARYSISIQDELGRVGADLINCTREDVLLSASVDVEDAASFASASLSSEEFRSTWLWAE